MPDPRTKDYQFKWEELGNIELGRPNLGATSSVLIYRLMQFSLKHVLTRQLGAKEQERLFQEAGHVAGAEFCRNLLDTELGFPEFIAQLQTKLKELDAGVLRVEKADLDRLGFIITVAEDLDCSGLPVSGQTVCNFEEGFLGGVLTTYTGKDFEVREIDCWASGGRICRFSANAT